MHLFLSPHFDDAVFSCGATIHQRIAAGETVRIITMMGGTPPTPLPNSAIIRELHSRWGAGETPIQIRRQEDQAAAQKLGAQVEHQPIPDCVYRCDKQGNALYPTEESLWENIHPKDPALGAVSGFRLPAETTHLYVPLGVGRHVDHLIVHTIGLGVYDLITQLDANALHQLNFYPEYPYTEQPGSLEQALAAVPANLKLKRHPVTLSRADIDAKIEAIKTYRSQISTFWEDETALEKRVRSALVQEADTPTEYFYQVQKG